MYTIAPRPGRSTGVDVARRGAPDATTISGPLPDEPASTLVGRETDLARLTEVCATTRVVTLSGPGGVGKTRLALRLARTRATAFAHGAWLVDLSGLSDPALVPTEVARVMGIGDQTRHGALEAL